MTPSRIASIVAGRNDWTALLGVGLVWFALDGSDPDALDAHPLEAWRRPAASPRSSRGAAASGPATIPATNVHRRLKESFDPAGIMAPGRGWGGI